MSMVERSTIEADSFRLLEYITFKPTAVGVVWLNNGKHYPSFKHALIDLGVDPLTIDLLLTGSSPLSTAKPTGEPQ